MDQQRSYFLDLPSSAGNVNNAKNATKTFEDGKYYVNKKGNRKPHRNNWKKKFSPKNEVLSEYSNLIFCLIFSKSQFFHFF